MNTKEYFRNRSFLRTITFTHMTELKMNSSIDAFTDEHTCKSNNNCHIISYWCIKRMAESISNLLMNIGRNNDKESISPIVRTILEQIRYRHSTMRKLMYKDCFKNAFCIMKSPCYNSISILLMLLILYSITWLV